MDFDIDAVLDQLEKTLNQSDLEEKKSNQIIETSPPPPIPLSTSTSRKSVDELLLLDLDPLGNTENDVKQENDEKLERLKQDLQELYASSNVMNPPVISTPILPDIIGQQEDFPSTTVSQAVEQLEIEVRDEILHHTSEQLSSSSLLLPDLTTLPHGNRDEKKDISLLSTSLTSTEEEEEEEQYLLSSVPMIETTPIFHKEPDLIQHETPPTQTPIILHSVDSIVNAPMVYDLEDFIAPNLSMIDLDQLQSSDELLFTVCNDIDKESIPSSSEQLIDDFPPISPSTMKTTTAAAAAAAPIQDFDLVKNILSEIFDKPDEEILDEDLNDEKESELINIEHQEILSTPHPSSTATENNDEDFRFLDEMLASIDVSDTDIHQLTPAEIDRVDNLLKQIVNSQEPEAISSSISNENESSTLPSEREPSPSPVESSFSPESTAAAASSIPIDEELIRVEHEWSKLTEEERRLGSIAPQWVNDDQAPVCMKCTAKFSMTRRRHHCRACGKVFCSTCCWQKVRLIHDDSKEDRACNDCVKTINEVEYLWNYMRNNQKPRSSVLRKRTGKFIFLFEIAVKTP